MILVDANVLMYAAGAEHPHKAPSIHVLERAARGEIDLAIDAEILQEILHRYRAIGRWADGRRLYDLVRTALPRVLPVTAGVVDDARKLLDVYPDLMARDALHAAVAIQAGAEAFLSYDRDFDAIEGIRRVEPGRL